MLLAVDPFCFRGGRDDPRMPLLHLHRKAAIRDAFETLRSFNTGKVHWKLASIRSYTGAKKRLGVLGNKSIGSGLICLDVSDCRRPQTEKGPSRAVGGDAGD
jgi:hypothetical protein